MLAVGLALVAIVYLRALDGAAGDEAGYPAAVPRHAAAPVTRGPARDDVAYFFVVATEDERLTLQVRLAMEEEIRGLVGELPRTAWVAVAQDDAEEDTFAAAIKDQEGAGGKQVVFRSLRRSRGP